MQVTQTLAEGLKREFRVPFVLDYQDPWVGEWGRSVGPGMSGHPDLRSRATRLLATRLEPRALVAADGTWSIPVTLSGEGVHYFEAKDQDSNGAVGVGGIVGYTLDTIAPAVTVAPVPPEPPNLTVFCVSGAPARKLVPVMVTVPSFESGLILFAGSLSTYWNGLANCCEPFTVVVA